MWNEHRAERVRRELVARAAASLTASELLEEVSALVHRVVPVDSSCWATFDPATTMIASTMAYALDDDARALERFLELEYGRPGPLAFRSLKDQRLTVAILGEHDAPVPGASEERARDHLAPMGFTQELRWLLASGGAAWGGVGMLRAGARSFSSDERMFLEQIGPSVASGLRAASVRARVRHGGPLEGPAILVFERGELASATAEGRTLLDAMKSLDRSGGPGLAARAELEPGAARRRLERPQPNRDRRRLTLRRMMRPSCETSPPPCSPCSSSVPAWPCAPRRWG